MHQAQLSHPQRDAEAHLLSIGLLLPPVTPEVLLPIPKLYTCCLQRPPQEGSAWSPLLLQLSETNGSGSIDGKGLGGGGAGNVAATACCLSLLHLCLCSFHQADTPRSHVHTPSSTFLSSTNTPQRPSLTFAISTHFPLHQTAYDSESFHYCQLYPSRY